MKYITLFLDPVLVMDLVNRDKNKGMEVRIISLKYFLLIRNKCSNILIRLIIAYYNYSHLLYGKSTKQSVTQRMEKKSIAYKWNDLIFTKELKKPSV